MPVPQAQQVHAAIDQEVEVLTPKRLVVEEGEQLLGVRVLVYLTARKQVRLLHADARAPQLEGGPVGHGQLVGQSTLVTDAAREFKATVEDSRIALADHRHS